jgi:hypothetical protein
MEDMTSTRRTNLFRIKAVDQVAVPLLSLSLTDLAGSTIAAMAEVRNNSRILGSGMFKPSFGDGNYTVHFCMDVHSPTTSLIDHVVVLGSQTIPDQEFVTLGDSNPPLRSRSEANGRSCWE